MIKRFKKAKATATKKLNAAAEAGKKKFNNLKAERARKAKEEKDRSKEAAFKKAIAILKSAPQVLEKITKPFKQAELAYDCLEETDKQMKSCWQATHNKKGRPGPLFSDEHEIAYNTYHNNLKSACKNLNKAEAAKKEISKTIGSLSCFIEEYKNSDGYKKTATAKTFETPCNKLENKIAEFKKALKQAKKDILSAQNQTKTILQDLPVKYFRSQYTPAHDAFMEALYNYLPHARKTLIEIYNQTSDLYRINSLKTEGEKEEILTKIRGLKKSYKPVSNLFTELQCLYNELQNIKKLYEEMVDNFTPGTLIKTETKAAYKNQINTTIAAAEKIIKRITELTNNLKGNDGIKRPDFELRKILIDKDYGLFSFVKKLPDGTQIATQDSAHSMPASHNTTALDEAPSVVVAISPEAAKKEERINQKASDFLDQAEESLAKSALIQTEGSELEKLQATLKNYKDAQKKIPKLIQQARDVFENQNISNHFSAPLNERMTTIENQLKGIEQAIKNLTPRVKAAETEAHRVRLQATADNGEELSLDDFTGTGLSFDDIEIQTDAGSVTDASTATKPLNAHDDNSTGTETSVLATVSDSEEETSSAQGDQNPMAKVVQTTQMQEEAIIVAARKDPAPQEDSDSGSTTGSMSANNEPAASNDGSSLMKPVQSISTQGEGPSEQNPPAQNTTEEPTMGDRQAKELAAHTAQEADKTPKPPESLLQKIKAQLNTNYSKKNGDHNRLFARPFKCLAKKRSKHKELARLAENVGDSLNSDNENQTQILYGLLVLIVLERSTERLFFSSTLVGIASNLIEEQNQQDQDQDQDQNRDKMAALNALKDHLSKNSYALTSSIGKHQDAISAVNAWIEKESTTVETDFQTGLSRNGELFTKPIKPIPTATTSSSHYRPPNEYSATHTQ